jgi:DNA polymerase
LKKSRENKMSCDALRDLVLSGVQWEISEFPTVLPVKSPVAAQETPVITVSRPQNTIVPPIAPVQTMSLDTVRSMAMRPTDIESLNRMIVEFNHPLKSAATNTVLPHQGRGKMLILTDMPSSDDDATGVALSGASGELMDKMLAAIGLSRDDVSVVPMLFWRTPGGRSPSVQELEMARPFVDRAIELIAPRVILSLGALPASEYAQVNIAKSHGVPVDMESGAVFVPIFHPNYLMLKPAAKRDVWTALQNVQNILKNA